MIKNSLIKLTAVFTVTSALLFTSCSTDIDLLEDYKPVTVVYGLLNVHDSTQYIRVSKAFLGEGNAMLMAEQSDSINYKPGEITSVLLQRLHPTTGEVLQTIPCDTTSQIPKDDGLFYHPNQVLYKTSASIDANSRYKLLIHRAVDGVDVTAVTPVIDSVTVSYPGPLTQLPMYSTISQTYQTFTLKWNHTADAFIYSAALQFTYYETLLVAPFTVVTKNLTMNLGEVHAGNSSVGEPLTIPVSGEDFFNFLESYFIANPNPNVQRTPDEYLEIFLSAGSEDLQTYIDITKPSIGLIQEKPAFTNITNGTGIFSTRWSKTLRNKMTLGTLSKVNSIL